MSAEPGSTASRDTRRGSGLLRKRASSATGDWTSRNPSGSRRSASERGTDCTPRQGDVGSSFAYSQLLIQPIQIARPSASGRLAKDRVA